MEINSHPAHSSTNGHSANSSNGFEIANDSADPAASAPVTGSETPAFYLQPIAPDRYSIPACGDGKLIHPIEVINHAATLESDEEARALVIAQANAVFTSVRMGRHIAAQTHRDSTKLALTAGYRSCSRLAALLGEFLEWTVIPGGDQPRTFTARVQITFFTVIGVLAMAADFLLVYLLLKDNNPESTGSGLLLEILAVVILPMLGVALVKGIPVLRHATPQARVAWERKFAHACWPAVIVLILAAAFRYAILTANPTQVALTGTPSLAESDGFRLVVFCIQIAAQVVASTAAFCCALRLVQETRPSIRRINHDHAEIRAKLTEETSRVQQNQDTLGWIEARVSAYKAERDVFLNECLAELAAKRDARKATLLEIGLLRRR